MLAGGSSGVGAAAMLDGRASIGMMSCEPSSDEADRMRQQGIERVRIAYDAVAVVVSDELYHQGGERCHHVRWCILSLHKSL